MAPILTPESTSPEDVGRAIGVGVYTLERWRSGSLSKTAWCRANGVYLQDSVNWRQSATRALAEPDEARASPNQTKQDRRRITELERDLRRRNAALAKTAASLVLSKET